MSLSTISGYAARTVCGALEPFDYEPPGLGEHDLRVSVTHCGVCHTDIHAIDDYYAITTFPFVPGHEIVGQVTDMGSAVTGLKQGDRVGIGWQARSCGKCEWCLKGEPQLCMKIEGTTVMVPYGGFSTSVIADERFVYPIPPGMPSEDAAVFMCAGITVFSALQTHLTSPQFKVAVLGIGGLGHLAIQFAHAFGCEVTAISSSPTKKDQAFGFGADYFLDSTDVAGIRKVDFNYDLVLCTTSDGTSLNLLLNAVKKRGKVVMVGFPDINLNSTNLVAHDLSIVGSLLGNPPTMRAMLSFAQEHGITPLVELMPMSQVNEALQIVKDGKARYRIVLVNED